jgi:glutaredoxin
MDSKAIKLYKKINNDSDIFIIFGLSYCGYCKNAINYLKRKNIPYKYYKIDNDYDIFFNLLKLIKKIDPNLNINKNHKTFPMIFFRKSFIGGYLDLIKYV